MDRSEYSRTPRSRTVVKGRIKAPQTLSSAVSRCIHRLRVAPHRKFVFSGLSRNMLERFPYLGFFHSLFFPCHWISFVLLLYIRRICAHSVDSSLTHFLGEFPGLGQAQVPDVVVPKAEQWCAWSRNLYPNFCHVRGRTSDLGI